MCSSWHCRPSSPCRRGWRHSSRGTRGGAGRGGPRTLGLGKDRESASLAESSRHPKKLQRHLRVPFVPFITLQVSDETT